MFFLHFTSSNPRPENRTIWAIEITGTFELRFLQVGFKNVRSKAKENTNHNDNNEITD